MALIAIIGIAWETEVYAKQELDVKCTAVNVKLKIKQQTLHSNRQHISLTTSANTYDGEILQSLSNIFKTSFILPL